IRPAHRPPGRDRGGPVLRAAGYPAAGLDQRRSAPRRARTGVRRERCADSGPVRGRGGELDLLLAQGRWLPHRRRAGLRPGRRPARRRTRLNPSPGTRAPRAPGGQRSAPPRAHPTAGRVCPQVLRYSPVLLFVRSGGARQSAAPSTRHPGRTATATGETAMFLAVRELLYARGRFTLMGLVIALIAVLMV